MNQRTPAVRRYAGITGFMTLSEVQAVLAGLPEGMLLMCGVLVSDKTLRWLGNSHPNRYPDPHDYAGIFPDRSPRVMNLLHLHTDDPRSLLFFMELGAQRAGENLDGFQINVAWPDPEVFREYRKKHPGHVIVLQVGPEAIRVAGRNESMIAARLEAYVDLVDYVLIDGSAGTGTVLDKEFTVSCLRAMDEYGLPFGRVVAGGLRPENAEELLAPVLGRYPDVSTDAEGGIRDAEDHLDVGKAIALLQAQSPLFAETAPVA